MPKRITDEQINYIKDNYKQIGCRKLANLMNLDRKTIYTWAKKFNLTKLSPIYTVVWVKLNCDFCNKEFKRTQNYIETAKKKGNGRLTCSRKCAGSKKTAQSSMLEAFNLAKSGLKNREISKLMNKPLGTIGGWLNRMKFRRPNGKSDLTIKNKFKKMNSKCEICGFDRTIDVAHITPVSKGGSFDFSNLLALCPNHHHLFDHNLLNINEAIKLSNKVENWKERVKNE